MIVIAPSSEKFSQVRLCNTILFKANEKYFYPLELNPYNYREYGKISVIVDQELNSIKQIVYYLEVNPFYFVMPFLETLQQYIDMDDALLNQPAEIKQLDFKQCQFVDIKDRMMRFNEEKYIKHCHKKYELLKKNNCESLAEIFFLYKQSKIIPLAECEHVTNSQPESNFKKTEQKCIVGPLDEFLRRK